MSKDLFFTHREQQLNEEKLHFEYIEHQYYASANCKDTKQHL